jgi:predicted nucleic acid-binding Zn ribbon protein
MKQKPKKRKCECGGILQRLISAGAGVIFKGDGFYRSVDYINQAAKEKGITTSERRINKGSL